MIYLIADQDQVLSAQNALQALSPVPACLLCNRIDAEGRLILTEEELTLSFKRVHFTNAEPFLIADLFAGEETLYSLYRANSLIRRARSSAFAAEGPGCQSLTLHFYFPGESIAGRCFCGLDPLFSSILHTGAKNLPYLRLFFEQDDFFLLRYDDQEPDGLQTPLPSLKEELGLC